MLNQVQKTPLIDIYWQIVITAHGNFKQPFATSVVQEAQISSRGVENIGDDKGGDITIPIRLKNSTWNLKINNKLLSIALRMIYEQCISQWFSFAE